MLATAFHYIAVLNVTLMLFYNSRGPYLLLLVRT